MYLVSTTPWLAMTMYLNETIWEIFTNVKIKKTKNWGLEKLTMLFRVVEETIANNIYRRHLERRILGSNVFLDQFRNYHTNIKLTTELNPNKFLDTKPANINGAYRFNVYQRNTKLTLLWTSKLPKHYKRNTVKGDLHRSKRISPNFVKEIPLMKERHMKADYPLRFINSVEFQ